MKEHIVIIGGGQSSAHAAKTIVNNKFDLKISIVSEENFLPY